MGRQTEHLHGLAVDRVDGAVEPGRLDVAQEVVADRVLAPARPDDGDRVGEQHGVHAHGLCAVFPREADRLGALGRLDLEAERDHAVLEAAVDLVAGVGEDGHHLAVLGQDLGGELLDAGLPGDDGQVLEQHRADAAALVGVRDVEGHLGGGRGDAVVPADPDDRVAHGRDQGDPVVVVDIGEAPHIAVAQLAQRREEAHVDRLVGLAGVEPADRLGVGWGDGPQVGHGAVPQDHVRLPFGGITRRKHGRLGHGPHGVMARVPARRAVQPRASAGRAGP